MRQRYAYTLLVALVLFLAPAGARAAMGFSAPMSGANEVPPAATEAMGLAQVILNDAETQITVHVEYFGLLGTETGAHIHGPACDPGTNAGVQIALPLGNPKDVVLAVTPEQVSHLKEGCLYVNVHSTQFPGGEIRGNLQRDDSLPALPSTWARVKATYR